MRTCCDTVGFLIGDLEMMFEGEYRFLSNFVCLNPIIVSGIEYPSVEHAYVAYKTVDLELRSEIVKIERAGKVKRYGRKLKIRGDFEFIKLNLMFRLVNCKFKANPNYLSRLKAIDGHIEESNLWHDNYWGDCKCNKCYHKKGENKLGEILMYIRESY